MIKSLCIRQFLCHNRELRHLADYEQNTAQIMQRKNSASQSVKLYPGLPIQANWYVTECMRIPIGPLLAFDSRKSLARNHIRYLENLLAWNSLRVRIDLTYHQMIAISIIWQAWNLSHLRHFLFLFQTPSVLVLQLPRYGKEFKAREKILPSLDLKMGNLLEHGKKYSVCLCVNVRVLVFACSVCVCVICEYEY